MKPQLPEWSCADLSMHRRSFLKLISAAAVLSACGDSDHDDARNGSVVTGRIDPVLLSPGLRVGSALGPSTVSGDTFTTTISDDGIGILALEDGTGHVRGFTLTFPGEVPAFSPEATALATIFMDLAAAVISPGLSPASPSPSPLVWSLLAAIRRELEHAAYPTLLRNRAATPLDVVSGDVEVIEAREDVVEAVGSQLPAQGVVVATRDESRIVLSNPSLRFLRVVRRDDTGDHVLDDFLPPYGTLVDRPPDGLTELSYLAAGAGHAVPGHLDASILTETYGPTAFFALVLPILELLGGKPIGVETGLRIYAEIEQAPVDEFAAAISAESTMALGATLVETETVTIGEFAELITGSFSQLTKLITAGSYVAGLAFSIGAILKFKRHKDNPTQVPIGTPIAKISIAAALFYLPSILSIAGSTLFGPDGGSVSGEPFEG